MTGFLQQLIAGLSDGAIYASLALAFVLVYRATGVLNFAQGEMAMLSTFVMWSLTRAGLPVGLAFLLTLVVSFAGGGAVYLSAIRPMQRKGHDELQVVVLTIGLLLGFNGAATYIWGSDVRPFTGVFPRTSVDLAGVHVAWAAIGDVAVIGAVGILVYLLFQHTRLGIGLRAASGYPESSRLVGIPVTGMLTVGWGLAAVVGALAGVLSAPSLYLEPNFMFSVTIYAFAAAVLGGLDSVLGAIVGGLSIGVLETLAGTYVDWIGPGLKVVVPLAAIALILILRPAGLFGRVAAVRL